MAEKMDIKRAKEILKYASAFGFADIKTAVQVAKENLQESEFNSLIQNVSSNLNLSETKELGLNDFALIDALGLEYKDMITQGTQDIFGAIKAGQAFLNPEEMEAAESLIQSGYGIDYKDTIESAIEAYDISNNLDSVNEKIVNRNQEILNYTLETPETESFIALNNLLDRVNFPDSTSDKSTKYINSLKEASMLEAQMSNLCNSKLS